MNPSDLRTAGRVLALAGLALLCSFPVFAATGAATSAGTRAAPRAGTGGDAPAPVVAGETRFHYGPFGEVTVYRPKGKVTSVALFISGDGGWNLGVVDMARHLLDMDALVVGIDIRTYLKAMNAPTSTCRYFGADFEGLSHEVERRFKLPEYLPPIVIGYSSGATLVYATIVQAPKGTFDGAMSLGFCPDFAVTQKICRGSGLTYDVDYGNKSTSPQVAKGVFFKESTQNTTPWAVFQGDADQVCDPPATRRFVEATGKGELIWLPKVGHGFSVEKNWLPQFRAAYQKLIARAAPVPATLPEVRDLPLVEVPAVSAAPADVADTFAVLLTGDGGWAGLDQDVAAALAARGVPVVGLNTLKYFWTARTPEVAAADLDRIIRRYGAAWKRPRVLLVGYSFGADALPFLVNRLAPELRASVRTVSLLGLSDTATFEFHVAEWIPGSGDDGRPTVPEIGRIAGTPVLCLYGAEEQDSPCPKLKAPGVHAVSLAGGHHFDGDYGALAEQILAQARR
jgi:type IV secretory pathway VirJ component